jgi:hypothetical protein
LAPPPTKRCPDCRAWKSPADFSRNARARDGRQTYCKECLAQRIAAWNRANHDRYYLDRGDGEQLKRCQWCGRARPRREFYHQVGTRDGRFGICRDCVSDQVLTRQANDPRPHRVAVARWRIANGARVRRANRAQKLVSKALRAEVLVRPGLCLRCDRACKPDAAHTDYDSPLEVVWLCRRCRAAWDQLHPKGPARKVHS